jgi:hypothetical protein
MIEPKEFATMLGRLALAATVVLTSSAWAQSVISAHSGVIQYVEGQVTLDGTRLEQKFAEFPDVKKGQTLAAQDGRAEILLTPGVFLRLAENSSFQMVSNKLSDTKIEVQSGSAMIEVSELLKDNAITVQFHDAQIELLKKGLYRVDSDDPARLRVYDGDARVTSGSQTVTASRGREVEIGTTLEARNFSTKDTDAFYRWSGRRDEYVAQANLVAAKTVSNSFYDGGTALGSGVNGTAGAWAYNPWYGMFTFVPGTGMFMSPFGYSYYSPFTIGSFYGPAYGYYGGGYVNPNSYTAVRTVNTIPALANRGGLGGPAMAPALASGGSPSSSSGSLSSPMSSGGGMRSGGRH